jgi:hypothetical protein
VGEKNYTGFGIGKPDGIKYLDNLVLDGRIILKFLLMIG